jgi:D-glycero-alpha-D-manno-heptose 1-phosphate guanylyltransferase
MINEAIVLAGGFGTRLQSVVNDLPKPMAPINGLPFLSFVFDYLQKYGIEHIILSVGYRHEAISSFYGNNYNNIKISYAIEDEPLGTGGAINFAMQKAETKNVFVINGDTLFNVNLIDFAKKHDKAQAELSIALRNVDDVSRYGTVEIDSQFQIITFNEKGVKTGEGKINGGIYIIPTDFFEKITIFTAKFSMEIDIFEKYYQKLNLKGFPFNEYFIDIGIPDDYQRAQIELLNLIS